MILRRSGHISQKYMKSYSSRTGRGTATGPHTACALGRRQVEGTARGLATPVAVRTGTGEEVLCIGLEPHALRHRSMTIPTMPVRPIRDISPSKGHDGLAIGRVIAKDDPTTVHTITRLANTGRFTDSAFHQVSRLPAAHFLHVVLIIFVWVEELK